MAIRKKRYADSLEESIILGWDSEYDTSGGFYPISTQFYGLKDSKEIFIEHVGRKISFGELIGRLCGEYPSYKSFILVTHFSIAELQGIADARDRVFEGGFRAIGKSLTGDFTLSMDGDDIHVQIIDTFLLFPKSLKEIGVLLGLPKLESDGHREEGRMLDWLNEEPEEFKRYAMRDAEIAVKFYDRFRVICANYGLKESLTIGGVYEKAIFREIANGEYRSLGYLKSRKHDGKKYKGYELSVPKHLNGFTNAYYGGRNETYLHGIYKDLPVYDYDLKSAYSTILSLIPSWDFGAMQVFTDAGKLCEFMKEHTLSVGYVEIQYKFKEDTHYPSLCIKYENGLFFVREGETVCTLQEFLVSYPHFSECQIIAKVYPSIRDDSVVSRFTERLKHAREDAKAHDDILHAEILKLILNSGYGKFAQGINEKKTTSLTNSTPERVVSALVPHSRIYAPTIASFITGCIRALIGEYLFYISSVGFRVGSVTTDGFTMLGNKLQASELNGVGFFSRYIASRVGGEILELKHEGKGFVGIKTRGYSILEGDKILASLTGVSLRGMTPTEKSAFIVSEFTDLSPYKDTKYSLSRVPSVREWLKGNEGNLLGQRRYNWDYDLKRKPIIPNDSCDDHVRFDTSPFNNIDELILWKEAYQDFKRGTRCKGRQVGVNNKLCSHTLLSEFRSYIELRASNFQSVQRINTDTNLRIFANLLNKLKGWGIKKISKRLSVGTSKVQYWIKKSPLSEEELKRGTNSEYISTIGSLFVPPELVEEVKVLYEKWLGDENSDGIPLEEGNLVTEQLMTLMANQNGTTCSKKNSQVLDAIISQRLKKTNVVVISGH